MQKVKGTLVLEANTLEGRQIKTTFKGLSLEVIDRTAKQFKKTEAQIVRAVVEQWVKDGARLDVRVRRKSPRRVIRKSPKQSL